MKQRQIKAHMEAARVYAGLSYCERRKVGCVIVKDDRIVSIGYNGTPAGECNTCEGTDGQTLTHVIHAEDNALRKLVNEPETCKDSTMFVTTAPCFPCAEKIIAASIKHVYYDDIYRNDLGIQHLRNNGVTVEQLT